jgi:hypothetical protein
MVRRHKLQVTTFNELCMQGVEVWRNCSPSMMAAGFHWPKVNDLGKKRTGFDNLTAMRLHADRGLCREIVQTIDKCPERADVALLNDCQSYPGRRRHNLRRHFI